MCDWVMTYDDKAEIRTIYTNYPMCSYQLPHNAANKGKGTELIIFKQRNLMPNLQLVDKAIKQLAITEIQER